MTIRQGVSAALAFAPLLLAAAAHGQDGTQQAAQHPGRSVVMSKGFQCHPDPMFRDQRQDRRAWESAIYRMLGRGGLAAPEETNLLSAYLSSPFCSPQHRLPYLPT